MDQLNNSKDIIKKLDKGESRYESSVHSEVFTEPENGVFGHFRSKLNY